MMKIKFTPEQSECIALCEWLDLHPLLKYSYFHIPNEGRRSKITAWILKRIGLKVGVSDYFIAYPSKTKHGLFIEMKRREGGKPSLQQIWFIDNMIKNGYAGFFANGFDEAKAVIEGYLQS